MPKNVARLRIAGVILLLLFLVLLGAGIGLAERSPWTGWLLFPLACVSLIAGMVLLIIAAIKAGVQFDLGEAIGNSCSSGCLVVLVVAGAAIYLLVTTVT